MNFFLSGIKGTGLSHLASFLSLEGNSISGCDVEEDFFTSALLKNFKIYKNDTHLPENIDVVIYSTAALKHDPIWYKEAKERGIKCYSYPEYLAYLSKSRLTGGIAGTHGKTTTAAISSHLIKSLDLKAATIYGSFLVGDSFAVNKGKEFLLLEACEYQDHYQLYDLSLLTITSIDFDHPDYFNSLEEVKNSFSARVRTLRANGVVIYHSSLKNLASSWKAERPDLTFIRYGSGSFSIVKGYNGYTVPALGDVSFTTNDKNSLILSDYLAAALTVSALYLMSKGALVNEDSLLSMLKVVLPHLSSFPGVSARGEVVLIEDGVTYIDDNAHHPEEIKTALDNLRSRYPHSRLVVLFMPHTASRTKALMKEFVSSLTLADAVFVEGLYTSAREDDTKEDLSKELASLLDRRLMRSFYQRLSTVMYTPTNEDTILSVSAFLQDGDVCITMGAGDNRALSLKIAKARKDR